MAGFRPTSRRALQATHPATGVIVLAGLLEQAGRDPAPLLAEAGLDEDVGKSPAAPVTLAQEMDFVRAVLRDPPWPDMGLRAGLGHHIGLFGAWGLALVSSADLGSAIRVGLKRIGLVHTFLRWSFERGPNEGVLEFHERLPLEELARFFFERDVAACVSLLTGLMGGQTEFEGVEFPFPAPPYAGGLQTALGAPVRYGRDCGRIRISDSLLRQPLPLANRFTAEASDRHCAELLRRMRHGGPLADQVRSRLLRAGGRFPSQAQMALQLHMSERTFRRRLEEDGQSFRSLRDEVRRQLAVTYLRDTHLSLAEIAERVGFSDAANFSHAFRRWYGQTPGSFRSMPPRADGV